MNTKIVYFDEYCPKCAHWEASEAEDPCYDCLNQGWNYGSHKPTHFEAAKAKEERRNGREKTAGNERQAAV